MQDLMQHGAMCNPGTVGFSNSPENSSSPDSSSQDVCKLQTQQKKDSDTNGHMSHKKKPFGLCKNLPSHKTWERKYSAMINGSSRVKFSYSCNRICLIKHQETSRNIKNQALIASDRRLHLTSESRDDRRAPRHLRSLLRIERKEQHISKYLTKYHTTIYNSSYNSS